MKQLERRERCLLAARRFLLGLGLLICGSVGAQNLLQNGSFTVPLGPTNWTLGYLHGGPDDFEIKDRVSLSSFGGNAVNPHAVGFRPMHDKLAHVYFTQSVTNLATNHLYTVSGDMYEEWWKGNDDAKRDKYLVYIEAIGGQGTPTPDGRASVLAATDPSSGIDPPYTYPTTDWLTFTAQQTPDAHGKIEVRLHMNKLGFVLSDKLTVMNGIFQDVSLTY
jgi:hypothetical protein